MAESKIIKAMYCEKTYRTIRNLTQTFRVVEIYILQQFKNKTLGGG